MKKTLRYCMLVYLLNFITCSQGVKNQNKPSQKSQNQSIYSLHKALKALEISEEMKNGTLAFSLKSVKDGAILLELNAQKTLNTASCLKAITTLSALEILGENYTFPTVLGYDGVLSKGILSGNLYLKGYGDPALGSSLVNGQNLDKLLANFVKRIKEKGIQTIKGKIIADESAFFSDITPPDWNWGDLGNYYATPAGAINVADNTYQLFFKPNKLGDIAPITRTVPFIPHIQFVNEVRTAEANSGDQASISGGQYESVRYVSGTVPLGNSFFIKGSIPDPAFVLVNKLHQALLKNGVSILQSPTTSRLMRLKNIPLITQRTLLFTHQSTSMRNLVDYTNLYSVNLYAEAMLKAIGLKILKKASTRAGAKAIIDFWDAKGIHVQGWMMQDGSGLSLSNGMTASQFVQILSKATKLGSFKTFYTSLPISGVSGTMKDVCAKHPQARNNLRAKTGGMTGVIAFTGYFRNSSGELRCFSLIANRYTCKYKEIKKKLENIMEMMIQL